MTTVKKIKTDDPNADLNLYLQNVYTPSTTEVTIDGLKNFVDVFTKKSDELNVIRCLTQIYMLNQADEIKERCLNYYLKSGSVTSDVGLVLEAARAAVLFDDIDAAKQLVERVKELLNFYPKVTGTRAKFTAEQPDYSMRYVCMAVSAGSGAGGSGAINSTGTTSGSVVGIENVSVESENHRLEVPEFEDPNVNHQCTSLLTTHEYLLLLILAEIAKLENPSISAEANLQVLPYIRRITETSEFNKVDWSVQLMALYFRSILESTTINELERGTVQLMKIADFLQMGSISTGTPDCTYFFELLPVSWQQIFELCGRRLVAVSDFANAIPYFQALNKPLELVKCYAAIDDKPKALEILESQPNLVNDNAQAALLHGDLTLNPEHWQRAWDIGQLDLAKLRLFHYYNANSSSNDAIPQLDDLLKVYPTHAEALYQAGMSAQQINLWEDSIELLKRAAAQDNDNPRIWHHLGTAFLQTDQLKNAHEALKQAIRTNQNTNPDLDTWCNFTALSAQLQEFDDVIWGLSTISTSGNPDSSSYIIRLRGSLPRLVTTVTKQEFTNSQPQKMLLNLFTTDLPKLIPADDPTLARLTAMTLLWAKQYQQGLKTYEKAFNSALNFTDPSDTRTVLRVKLYGNEFINSLELYANMEGRIEGSKAYSNPEIKIQEVKNKLDSLV